MLLSRHRDAEILSYAAYHLGFDFVRGSTNRGGAAALRQLLAKSRHMHLTITPDGPRGPRRHMAPGPIFLASKLGLPLVLWVTASTARGGWEVGTASPFRGLVPGPAPWRPAKSTSRPTWTARDWSIFAAGPRTF